MRDGEAMARAIAAAQESRIDAHPNPWVGCVIVTGSGRSVVGRTQPPGGLHAEADALARAGWDAEGGTAVVTLEPCSHHGRTPPCADALIDAGVRRVVVAITDPDPRVAGAGIERLRAAGIDVEVGVGAADVERQLAPYLHHRRTGRPYVVAKLAATVDGGTAAPDGSSQWITGSDARTDAHRLRAESDAIVVGAGTVRTDDPSLTVRHVTGPDPVRIVLGDVPPGAAVRPCRIHHGDPADLLRDLGEEGMVQVMIEGGAGVLGDFHRQGLVDRYVVYLAPALFGGDDALGVFRGAGASTIADAWRGEFDVIARVGADLRVEIVARRGSRIDASGAASLASPGSR